MPDDEKTIQQLEARIRGIKARKSEKDRKDLTRKKIIYGAAVLNYLVKLDGLKREAFLVGLHGNVTRPADRKFLGLDE